MVNPKINMHAHISIEEMNSLTEAETDMLLYICNVLYPIRPPVPTEHNKHPITDTYIRSANKDFILARVIESESAISETGKEVYNTLRNKLSIPLEKKVEQTQEPVKV